MEAEYVAAIFAGVAAVLTAVGAVVHKVFREWMEARAKELREGATVAVMRPEDVRRVVREELDRELKNHSPTNTSEVRRIVTEELERERALIDARVELAIARNLRGER